jgi:hypothetical protein
MSGRLEKGSTPTLLPSYPSDMSRSWLLTAPEGAHLVVEVEIPQVRDARADDARNGRTLTTDVPIVTTWLAK